MAMSEGRVQVAWPFERVTWEVMFLIEALLSERSRRPAWIVSEDFKGFPKASTISNLAYLEVSESGKDLEPESLAAGILSLVS